MNHKQKLGYMALGAGILALGIIIGQWVTPDIEAQNNSVFDKIQCRELRVVDENGNKTIFLGIKNGSSTIECNTTTDDLSNCSFSVSTDGVGSELKLYNKKPGGGFNSRFEVSTNITGGNLTLSNNTLDGGIELASSSTENRVLVRDAWQDLAIGLHSRLLLGNEILVVNGTVRKEDR